MPEEHSFAEKRNDEVAIFAGIIARWLGDMQGPAVVGLNEIRFAPGIAIELVAALQARNLNVGMATHESNGIVWRAPPSLIKFKYSLSSRRCPAWCLDAQRAVARLQNTLAHDAHGATRTQHVMPLA